MAEHKPRYRIKWFSDDDTHEERKLIVRLDLLIVPYAFLSYWTKYIDQANLNNAYVSGMKEDLNFQGNQLVELQTMYTVGAVVGQIPFMFLFTVIPMNNLIPFLDVCWGVFTLLQYRATTFAEIAAYRFLVGWFEAAFFPAIHYIFGAWYRGDEIARRGGVFYVGLTLGTLTAGLIQAGASASLDGVGGLAGWRWMYIICALITIPIGLLGLLILPGTPDMPNRIFLSKTDIILARDRLQRAGHNFDTNEGCNKKGVVVATKKLRPKWIKQTLINVAKNWQFWALLWLDIFFWNACYNAGAGGFLLWLKSLGRYSTARVNELGTIAPALGIFYTLLICFASDLVLGPAWAITAAHIWNVIGLVILVIWNVPESAKWFAFATTYSSVAMSSVLYGWVNHLLRGNSEERAFVLVLVNCVAQSTTAWTPLLVFKTVEGPRFLKGYSFVLGNAVCLIATAHWIRIALKREAGKTEKARESTVGDENCDVEVVSQKEEQVRTESDKSLDGGKAVAIPATAVV